MYYFCCSVVGVCPILTLVMEIWPCDAPPLTFALVTMDNATTNWTSELEQSDLALAEFLLMVADNDTQVNGTQFEHDSGNGQVTKSCGEWEPAQHNLFQLSNLFFAAAFLVPRSYKQSVLLLR